MNRGCSAQIDRFTAHVCAMILMINFFPLLYTTYDQGICLLGMKSLAEESLMLGID